MRYSWTKFFSLILPTALLWLTAATSCPAQLQPPTEPSPSDKHGQSEVLLQHLVRDRQIESLLRTAESVGDRRDAELRRESLLHIFGLPHDVFELEPNSATAISVRSRALNLLLKSPPDVQRLWIDANKIIAEQELQTAIRNGGRLEAARVARKFPLTAAGIQAQVLDMSCELLKGDVRKVAAQILYLEKAYAGTLLSDELARLLQPLREMIADRRQKQQQDPNAKEGNSNTNLSFPATASVGTISPPWPKPLWTWRESIWTFPGVPQPEAGYLLMMFDPEAADRFEEFNNWRPIFWGDSVVVRSPFRLVALNRANGKEQWSVPTDTFERQPDVVSDELETATRRAMNESQSTFGRAAPIYGLAEFGLVASDDEFLFFVDRFSFFAEKDTFVENQPGRVIRQRNGFPVIEEDGDEDRKPSGTRLVALRRSPHNQLPMVAWTIGDRAGFEYRPVAQGTLIDAEFGVTDLSPSDRIPGNGDKPVDEDTIPADPWKGHRFLAPPTGQGMHLFVLSLNENRVFLNCLQRNSGDLAWRQPLIDTDENELTVIDMSVFSKRTSTCVVSGNTVVCSLADGVVIGVDAVDGVLLWATAIGEAAPTVPQFGFGASSLPDESSIVSPSILVPCISDGIVVCCTHESASLYGLSIETGEIVWKTSRRAFGAGEVGGSPDYYVAGISGDQIILVGDRHCRSVHLQTGIQNWVVQIPAVSGRAECRGDRCVIPLFAGQAVTVNLNSGTLISQAIIKPLVNSMDQYGAAVSDEELICVSTPTCVAAFPRVDSLLRSVNQLPALNENPSKRVLIQAQAHLINGDPDTSLNLLREYIASRTSNAKPETSVDEFLAELVLQQWGQAVSRQLEVSQRIMPVTISLPAAEVPADSALLATLNLPDELRFKADLFKLLSEPASSRTESPMLARLRQQRAWSRPVSLTRLWNVRPELLFDVPTASPPLNADAIDSMSREELKQLVRNFLLHPDFLPENLMRQRLAERLLNLRQFAILELFLTKWHQETMSADDESASSQPIELLRRIRQVDDSSKQVAGPDSSNDRQFTLLPKGLTSAAVMPLVFEFQPCIRQSDLEFEIRQQGKETNTIPDRCQLNTYTADDADGVSEVMAFNANDGTLRDRVVLPFQHFHLGGRFVPLSNGELTPALFPVCGIRDIAMVACPVPGSSELLWTRRFRNDKEESVHVEYGPLGADHFVWQFDDELHCSNPLTGEDLWTRQLAISQSEQTILFRGVSPSVRRISGDHKAVLVMGSDSRSFQRFNTQDGRLLGSGRLEIGQSESVVVVGRCLLYTDSNSRLHLFDSATGQDELADEEPIVPRSNKDGKMFCRILDGNRTLLVSSALELIMIDTERGTVLFRTSVAEFVKSGFVFSFSAFTRNGKLFAALSKQGSGGPDIERAFVRGSPRLSNGPLICLDPVSGNVHWSLPVSDGVFPEVYGDPTDLMLSWSLLERSPDEVPHFYRADRLVLEVIDLSTGQLIARSPACSSLPPLRCIHVAEEGLIQVTTPNATIKIQESIDDSTLYP